ncbi:ROK family transcriptional regulator [Streptomyces sp. NBC_00370]|uniref:ROK family transcriptional regulator n=1 Tax=Streptomyces sp. NBC_00370 TaxID=2975728 RepID=UPI002E2678C8
MESAERSDGVAGKDSAAIGGKGGTAAAGTSGAAAGEWAGPGANLPVLRGHNAALVLDLLRAAGAAGISRLELAERTGLTPQAVSKITARLRADGLAAEAGRRASTGGKPRTVLRLVPSAAHAVGLHLDRDELTAVLVDLAGTRVAVRTSPLDLGAGAERVVAEVAAQVAAVRADAVRADAVRADAAPADAAGAGVARPAPASSGVGEPLGVGVAMPGPLDHTTGVTRRITGFPQWAGFPLRATLADRLGLPVVLDKDTNAAALGLAPRGPGDSFAYLHLGTGLGAGLVLDGVLHRGDHTGAGEFGHQVVQLDGPLCHCGNHGCIEALCLAAVARGEPAEAARVLGHGAANLVELLGIHRVLLGGRTVDAHQEDFVRGVAAVLAARARDGAPVPVAAAGGGPHQVAEGAAQLVLAPVFGRSNGTRLGR